MLQLNGTKSYKWLFTYMNNFGLQQMITMMFFGSQFSQILGFLVTETIDPLVA